MNKVSFIKGEDAPLTKADAIMGLLIWSIVALFFVFGRQT